MGLMKTALEERNIEDEDIDSYMRSPAKTIPSDATLRDLLKQMKESRVSSLLVSENNDPVGIVTKNDFIRKAIRLRLDPATTKVSEVMSSPILTLERSTPLEDAKSFMDENKIGHVPVVEKGQIVGMLFQKDTVRKEVDQKLIDAFSKSTIEALQNFMLETSPLAPTLSEDLPGEISAIINLTDEAKNVEITIILNCYEEVAQKIYQGLFGEDASSMKDVCNIVTEIVNIMAGNVKVEIADLRDEILTLTHSVLARSTATGNFNFEVGLPTTIVGSGHNVFGDEKSSTAKAFIPFEHEGTQKILLGLIFQKKAEV